MRMLRLLLSNRQQILTHDEHSRALWESIDPEIVRGTLELVLQHGSRDDSFQPLLLASVDLLDTVLFPNDHAEEMMGTLDADSVEKLIHLVKPLNLRYDFPENVGATTGDGYESDTPPAHNLSRMDEGSICIELEDEESAPRGLNVTVQVAMASVIARLGFSSFCGQDESIGLLKSRMCTAVNDFLASFQPNSDPIFTTTSFDSYKRELKLQRLTSEESNVEFVAMTSYTKHCLQLRSTGQLQLENKRLAATIKASKLAEESHRLEKESLISQLKSQRAVFQRELRRVSTNNTQEANHMVAHHAAKRSQVEGMLSDAETRIEEAETQLEQLRMNTEESQKITELTKEELQIALTKVSDLTTTNNDLNDQIRFNEAKATELTQELTIQREKLDNLAQSRDEVVSEIQQRDDAIAELEGSNENLRRDLEELFADMVSLSQVYRHNESEQHSWKERMEKEKRGFLSKLDQEREKNIEMSATLDQVRQENEKLYKKLAKYKDRLESERQERRDTSYRQKRNGPVSYMNSLHTSTVSSHRSNDGGGSYHGKENRTSSSTRRKRLY